MMKIFELVKIFWVKIKSMSLENWYVFFQAIGVFLVAVTFVVGAVAFWLNLKVNKAQKAEIRRKDEQLALELKDKDLQISIAKKDSAEANERVVQANAQIAEANVKIADAKSDAAKANERAQKVSLDLQKAAKESELERQKLAKMQIELAQARQQQAVAERSLEEIKLRIRPRSLTSQQRSSLTNVLRSQEKGTIEIVCPLGDAESFAFATELDGLLKAAGWSTKGVSQAVFTNNPIGIGIIVKNAKTAPRYAAILQQAFFNIGLPIDGVENSELPEATVKLIVGIKP